PPGVAPMGAAVAASTEQAPNQLDVFFVDTRGAVEVTWVLGTGTWNPVPVPITPHGLFPAGANLVPAKQNANLLGVFAVANDGALRVTSVLGGGHWTDGSPGYPAPQRLSRAVWMLDWPQWPHIHGTPVFGKFADGSAMLYVWPEKDHLKGYPWLGTKFDEAGK